MHLYLAKSLKMALLMTFTLVPSTWAGGTSETKNPSNVPAGELKWLPTPVGPMASPVQGDFNLGSHITYLKFQAGAKTPLHIHSADYVGIVLSGRMRHEAKGFSETARVLEAGSHWFMPGNVEHVSECLPGKECVLVIIQTEKFDFQPVEKRK
jgi:quercetin dioxygenase-like cupin family protein